MMRMANGSLRIALALLAATSLCADAPHQAALQNAVLFNQGAAPAWQPTNLGAALVAAYDPTDVSTITQSAGAVSQWNDISGNGKHLVQATSGNKPTYSATSFMGKPGVTLDGTDDFMDATSVNLGTTKFSCFVFMQAHYSATTQARLLAYTGAGQSFDFVSPQSAVLIEGRIPDATNAYRGGNLSSWLYTGIEPCNGGFYRIASVWDATNHTIYTDNQAQTPAASSGSLASPGTLRLGANASGAANWKGAVGRILLMNRDPTSDERLKVDQWLQAPWSRFVCIEGDSKATFGTPTNQALPFGYSFVVIPNLNPPAIVRNRAIGGSSLNSTSALVSGVDNSLMRGNRPAWTDSSLPADKQGKTYILFIDIGANAPDPSASVQASDLATYCAARKAAGWDKIVVATLLSRTDGAGMNDTERNAYNTILTGTGWAAAHSVDAICDFAADSIMGVNAAPTTNPTYFSDGVHPNAAGHVRLEAIMRATINGL